MKAMAARKLVNKSKDPETLKDIYKQIKKLASLGYRNTAVDISKHYISKTYEKIQDSLTNNGFNVIMEDLDDKLTRINIEW